MPGGEGGPFRPGGFGLRPQRPRWPSAAQERTVGCAAEPLTRPPSHPSGALQARPTPGAARSLQAGGLSRSLDRKVLRLPQHRQTWAASSRPLSFSLRESKPRRIWVWLKSSKSIPSPINRELNANTDLKCSLIFKQGKQAWSTRASFVYAATPSSSSLSFQFIKQPYPIGLTENSPIFKRPGYLVQNNLKSESLASAREPLSSRPCDREAPFSPAHCPHTSFLAHGAPPTSAQTAPTTCTVWWKDFGTEHSGVSFLTLVLNSEPQSLLLSSKNTTSKNVVGEECPSAWPTREKFEHFFLFFLQFLQFTAAHSPK